MNYEKNIRDTAKIILIINTILLAVKAIYLLSDYFSKGGATLLNIMIISWIINIFTIVYGIKQAKEYEEPLFYIEPIPPLIASIVALASVFSSSFLFAMAYPVAFALMFAICFTICKKHQGK